MNSRYYITMMTANKTTFTTTDGFNVPSFLRANNVPAFWASRCFEFMHSLTVSSMGSHLPVRARALRVNSSFPVKGAFVMECENGKKFALTLTRGKWTSKEVK
jgi:hypothetical protein